MPSQAPDRPYSGLVSGAAALTGAYTPPMQTGNARTVSAGSMAIMPKHKFTSAECSRGGTSRCNGEENHYNACLNGWASLCDRHGRKAALAIIKPKEIARGKKWGRKAP